VTFVIDMAFCVAGPIDLFAELTQPEVTLGHQGAHAELFRQGFVRCTGHQLRLAKLHCHEGAEQTQSDCGPVMSASC